MNRLLLALGLMFCGCDDNSRSNAVEPSATILYCDGTGPTGATCTKAWLEFEIRAYAKVAISEPTSQAHLIMSSARFGKTSVYPLPSAPTAWMGNRRVAQHRWVEAQVASVDNFVIPEDSSRDVDRSLNQSNHLDGLALIGRLACSLKRDGLRVRVAVASDGRFISGPFNASNDVPNAQDVWGGLDADDRPDLSCVDKIDWCGQHHLEEVGAAPWSVGKAERLEAFTVEFIRLAGGPKMEIRHMCTGGNYTVKQ